MKVNYKSICEKKNKIRMTSQVDNEHYMNQKKNNKIRRTRTRNKIWCSEKGINYVKTRHSGKSCLYHNLIMNV